MTQLTHEQQDAAQAFFSFMMTDDAPTFILSGGAGVGKTYLMDYISKVTMKKYLDGCKILGLEPDYDEVVFTATTNKAAEVLEKTIGKHVSTIHSYLGLKVKEDYSTGKTNLIETDRYGFKYNKIVFIDECSMIDTALMDLIMKSFKDSKIVFVGDHAQMAPINEESSPIYDDVDPDNFVFLSQPVRNAGSPALVNLCTQLRNTVETGVFNPIMEVPGSIEYLDDSQMQHKLAQVFMDPNHSSRVLCYTNTRVAQFNEHLRAVRGLPEEFVVGDVLVVASTYAAGKTVLNVEREVRVVEADNLIHEGGYEWAFTKKPLIYRKLKILPLSGPNQFEVEVKVPVNTQVFAAGLKVAAKAKRWQEYYALKNGYADLRDRDACTVYKSQGSTYETVFIDIGNIGTSYDPVQVARMLFVGVSRATTKVYLYGRLPSQYVGKAAA